MLLPDRGDGTHACAHTHKSLTRERSYAHTFKHKHLHLCKQACVSAHTHTCTHTALGLLMSAPCDSSSDTTSACPCLLAYCSGVLPHCMQAVRAHKGVSKWKHDQGEMVSKIHIHTNQNWAFLLRTRWCEHTGATSTTSTPCGLWRCATRRSGFASCIQYMCWSKIQQVCDWCRWRTRQSRVQRLVIIILFPLNHCLSFLFLWSQQRLSQSGS